MLEIRGHAIKYGHNINTDLIIPARYCINIDEEELSRHCMEDLDVDFLEKIEIGDVLIAGENFGCGSSREAAPMAIKRAKLSCVVASSFARIFFRNAINIGLPIFESKEAYESIENGDLIEIFPENNLIKNLTKKEEYKSTSFPPIIREVISKGGMVNFVREKLKQL
jgi:3-isopropylmalate/(R)-2-methylmalate dehydratase small subunit